jgi:competence protein ComEA
MKSETRNARATWLVLLMALGVFFAAAPTHAAGSGGLTGVVNINTATADELQILPGIGEARAKAVIALRKQNGGFKSADDLLAVKGIGETALKRLRPFVSTEGKTTARVE